MRGADPAIVLVPGVGMFSFGDKQTARVAGEFYLNAINVMRGAEALSTYQPIDEREKFRIEYWALEEAKLARHAQAEAAGHPGRLCDRRRIGIGRAIAHRLAAEGACVVVADRDAERAQEVATEIGGADAAVAVAVDVTDENEVAAAVAAAALAFGGVDLVVNNAGLSISKPLLDTTAARLGPAARRHGQGSFLVSREAARVMSAGAGRRHRLHLVSKNGVFAGPEQRRLRRGQGRPGPSGPAARRRARRHGIRVNGVNPDGVVRGSGIFAGGWGAQRAAVYGVPEADLGEFYAQRTLLKSEVLPEHVAAAVFALCGGDLSQTTGLHIPVDSGVAAAFLR